MDDLTTDALVRKLQHKQSGLATYHLCTVRWLPLANDIHHRVKLRYCTTNLNALIWVLRAPSYARLNTTIHGLLFMCLGDGQGQRLGTAHQTTALDKGSEFFVVPELHVIISCRQCFSQSVSQ